MKLQRNVWYVAAWPEEVGRTPLGRTFVEQPVVLFRTGSGDVAAISGVCPHRFAPLSMGELIGDVLECKYHGLRFDRWGSCVFNPHGDRIPAAAHVAAFPIAERHGLIWIWLGEKEKADLALIPEVSFLAEGAGFHSAHNYVMANYRYDILVDNLMDLSHVDYLHKGSFSAAPPARSTVDVKEQGNDVIVVRTNYGMKLPPGPRAPELQGKLIDQRTVIHWHPGQVISFEEYNVLSGASFPTETNMPFAHIATPATKNKTHYFFCVSRNFDLGNAQLDAAIRDFQRSVIDNEDGKMLEAVDSNMGGAELADKRPLFMSVDSGAMRVRLVMERQLASERAFMVQTGQS